MDLSSRLSARERLDAAKHDPEQLEVTLDHLVRVNRWLGGARVVLAHLAKWLPAVGSGRVLDVGTGAGDIPQAIARWATKHGRVVDICAVDLRSVIARQARNRCRAEPSIRVLAADGMELPFGCNTFDVAIRVMPSANSACSKTPISMASAISDTKNSSKHSTRYCLAQSRAIAGNGSWVPGMVFRAA